VAKEAQLVMAEKKFKENLSLTEGLWMWLAEHVGAVWKNELFTCQFTWKWTKICHNFIPPWEED
jgi:hypothetical protein